MFKARTCSNKELRLVKMFSFSHKPSVFPRFYAMATILFHSVICCSYCSRVALIKFIYCIQHELAKALSWRVLCQDDVCGLWCDTVLKHSFKPRKRYKAVHTQYFSHSLVPVTSKFRSLLLAVSTRSRGQLGQLVYR